MGGKSTFLRQNALIVVLAQVGSFVPAKSAHIGLVDRLFSRVGASDDLARGRSTFMVEMVETAAILNQATPRSFVVLDEIGRGTATFDGLSIAWAALEYLHEINRSRVLFATHYHELTALADRLPHAANATVEVKEWREEIVFPVSRENGRCGSILWHPRGQARRVASCRAGPRRRGARVSWKRLMGAQSQRISRATYRCSKQPRRKAGTRRRSSWNRRCANSIRMR